MASSSTPTRWDYLKGWSPKGSPVPKLKPGEVQDMVDRVMTKNRTVASKGKVGTMAGLGLVGLAGVTGGSAILAALRKYRKQEDETARSHGSPENLRDALQRLGAKGKQASTRIRKATLIKK